MAYSIKFSTVHYITGLVWEIICLDCFIKMHAILQSTFKYQNISFSPCQHLHSTLDVTKHVLVLSSRYHHYWQTDSLSEPSNILKNVKFWHPTLKRQIKPRWLIILSSLSTKTHSLFLNTNMDAWPVTSSWEWIASGTQMPDQFGQKLPITLEIK